MAREDAFPNNSCASTYLQEQTLVHGATLLDAGRAEQLSTGRQEREVKAGLCWYTATIAGGGEQAGRVSHWMMTETEERHPTIDGEVLPSGLEEMAQKYHLTLTALIDWPIRERVRLDLPRPLI